jgi:3-carboxy-cis,cis-muconate cycloisomerase
MSAMDPRQEADTGLLSPGWAGTVADSLLGDAAVVTAMLDVEVALAAAQARLGVIPRAAADVIATAATAQRLDVAGLVAGVRATANPVVALVARFTAEVAAIDPAASDFVHRGGTSQDILDSALMLLCTRAFGRILGDLDRCADSLAALAARHRDTPMAGRTLTQHAVPITFGLKAAVWLQLVLDALDRCRTVADHSLVASLGGAAGTLAAYAEYARLAGVPTDGGVELIAPFAAELGLREPVLPWHGVRTPIADVAGALTIVTGALGKFATDVQVLTRTEIRELVEPAAPGRGASSAMPQKHNPVFSTLILAAARQQPANALVLFGCMVVEDERSAGGWHAEWQPLRECLRLAVGAAANAAELAAGLTVRPERMRANLDLTGAAVVSERLNAVLAPTVGKAAAKKLLTSVIEEAERTGTDVITLLGRELERHGHPADVDRLGSLVDPAHYLGASTALVDRVLARHRERRPSAAVSS